MVEKPNENDRSHKEGNHVNVKRFLKNNNLLKENMRKNKK